MITFSNLSDKIILITGASRGLGKELAMHLSQEGSKLILVARSKNSLIELQQELKDRNGRVHDIFACDVSQLNEVKQLAEFVKQKYAKIDVLINNAAIAFHKNSEDITYNEMKHQFEVNFFGAFYCIRELLPLIKASANGYILNIGSIADRTTFANNAIYASTKSALRTFTKGLRIELTKFNIKTGIIYPGLMKTALQNDCPGKVTNVPSFFILNPNKVANRIVKMIEHRLNEIYMYRWMIWLMKIKSLINNT